MDVILLDIVEIKPYKNNPRNNDTAVDKVANSIKEFGWVQPIVLDQNHIIIAGHTRYKAAKKLGIEKVPVYIAKNLTEKKTKALRIADNRLSAESNWDIELLNKEIQDLIDADFDLEVLGFNKLELENLFTTVDFEPVEQDFNNRLDEKKKITCPNCKHVFEN